VLLVHGWKGDARFERGEGLICRRSCLGDDGSVSIEVMFFG
jgi:hypothetical protein